MTELQWLIQMLTKQKLSPALKDLFIERIGQVEMNLSFNAIRPVTTISGSSQAPSTQKLLDEMAQQTGAPLPGTFVEVAQTPAAAQALQARKQAIMAASSGKPEPGRTSPRKF